MAISGSQRQAAVRHLRRRDPVLRAVIERVGPFQLQLKRNRFQTLVGSIIAQQISTSAARSIQQRLRQRCPRRVVTAKALASWSPEDFREVGISRQKAGCLQDLARRSLAGEVRLHRFARWDDERVIAELVQVKGIGRWTAQMFLIFSLGRLDVLAPDDLGLRTAVRKLYGLPDLPDRRQFERIAQPWRPYASVASWYCWRSLQAEAPFSA